MGDQDLPSLGGHVVLWVVDPPFGTGWAEMEFALAFEIDLPRQIRHGLDRLPWSRPSWQGKQKNGKGNKNGTVELV